MTIGRGRPQNEEERSAREIRCYDFLDSLGISYLRADHDPAATMEDCERIDRELGGPICKNLFLRNRQGTKFYLLLMPGNKPFRTKELSAQIGSSRLSFGEPADMMRLIGTEPGCASVLGLMNDTEQEVALLVDRDVLREERFGCHPCANTSSVLFSTKDLLEKILPALGRQFQTVELIGSDEIRN